jgi:MFS family permease
MANKDNEVIIDHIDVDNLHTLRRLSAVNKQYTTQHQTSRNPIAAWWNWYISWAIPGLGMFSEAYIIFSLGLTRPLQTALHPKCFKTHETCPETVTHVQNYIQICGIIVGMLLFGFLGDLIGRKWGSRSVASIMLSGTILLTFAPLVADPATYLNFYIFAATWYGFGVGGEYPMASSSAAERSQADDALRHRRGEQVVLTFSGQGMGNFVNGCIILIFMAIFGMTGSTLDRTASRNVLMIQFAVGAAVSVFMVLWRYFKLQESKVWEKEKQDFEEVTQKELHRSKRFMTINAFSNFWPRLTATSLAWVANDFAFYGNKLFQSTFIALLYPKATEFERMQWTVLNSAISLLGYWCAAALVDKKWYGRCRMQNIGFIMMFVLFLICGVAFPTLTASETGLRAFQALYFLSSFFNQFGPNCTTWLVAAESFPTDVRATFQGISAAMGKVGAIIADIVFAYVDKRMTFILSAISGLIGWAVTWLFLPDTTGLSLDELDRMAKYMLAGEFHHYHGEGVNPKHLSTWERWVWKWHQHYDPDMDQKHKLVQLDKMAAEFCGEKLEAELAATEKVAKTVDPLPKA